MIDIEASALGYGSYPLEVGVAFIHPVREPIEVWSTLIKPLPEWLEEGTWSDRSAAIHGISIDNLERYGIPAHEACDLLNRYLAGQQVVVSDALIYDMERLHTLFLGRDREQLFGLRHIEVLTRDFSPDQHRQCKRLPQKESPTPSWPRRRALGRTIDGDPLGYPQ